MLCFLRGRDVLGLYLFPSESSAMWQEVLEDLWELGVREALVFVGDGLPGMQEAILRIYPKADWYKSRPQSTGYFGQKGGGGRKGKAISSPSRRPSTSSCILNVSGKKPNGNEDLRILKKPKGFG